MDRKFLATADFNRLIHPPRATVQQVHTFHEQICRSVFSNPEYWTGFIVTTTCRPRGSGNDLEVGSNLAERRAVYHAPLAVSAALESLLPDQVLLALGYCGDRMSTIKAP
jgi:hypothetical protein